MIYEKKCGVPRFESTEIFSKNKDYVTLIPVINEGERIYKELLRAYKADISDYTDIVIIPLYPLSNAHQIPIRS